MSYRQGSFVGRQQSAKRRGFGLIDVILAVGASAVIYAGMAQLQNDQRMSASAVTTAHQLAMVSEAAKAYVKKNYIKLTSLVPTNSVVEIPLTGSQNWGGIGDVQYGGGLLSSSFNPTLPNGQTIHFLARHVSSYGNIPDHLESMLVTSGVPMSDRQVGMAMNVMEGNGGGVMTRPPMGIPANVIQGSFGSWSQPIGTWSASGVPITSGHIAYAMDNIGSPLSDYLDRYNTGNPEANRMHTSIDFNGNDANNMNNLDTQTVSNSRSDNVQFNTLLTGNQNNRITNVSNAVGFKEGANFCSSNTYGCGVSISDDGGFYDYNDYWITLSNPTSSANRGLHLADNGNSGGNLWADGNGRFNGRVGVEGLDPNNVPSGWGGGIRTIDVVASATVAATINGDVNNLGAVMNNGGFRVGDHLDAWNAYAGNVKASMSNNGDIYAANRLGSGGYHPGQGDPYGWRGGLSTFDIVAHGTGAFGVDNNGNANVLIGTYDNGRHNGDITASERVRGQVLHPTYIATQGWGCSGVAYGDFGNRNQYTLSNGDIATDNHGSLMSCVDGTWRYAGGKQFSNMTVGRRCGTWSGYNPTSQPHLEILEIHAGHKGATAVGRVNGGEISYISWSGNNSRVSQTMTLMVPPYGNWSITDTNRVDDVCQTEYE